MLMQSANLEAASQKLQLIFPSYIRVGKFGSLWPWHGCCRSLGIFTENKNHPVIGRWVPCWCQGRLGRLTQADKKAKVTRIATLYNRGEQERIAELWGRWATTAEDRTGFQSCQPGTGIWGSSQRRLIKPGQIGKNITWSFSTINLPSVALDSCS